MSLFFRPKPFVGKDGKTIELEDIEIEDIDAESCQCGCNSATLNITILRNEHGPTIFKDTEIYELQECIEKAWNSSSIPEMVFKKK